MIYVTSDLHGYSIDKFKALLDVAGFSANDRLIILGDVIDRGPDGIKLLKWIMKEPNVELILGNHEDMMLDCDFILDTDDVSAAELGYAELIKYDRWLSNGGEDTVEGLKELTPTERREIFDYLSDLDMYKTVGIGSRKFVLVHGGLGNYSGERELFDYSSRELLWERPALSDNYSFDFITVFGHTPTLFYSRIYRGRMIKTATWIDIDTGAAAGLAPMLLRLDDLKEFYAGE